MQRPDPSPFPSALPRAVDARMAPGAHSHAYLVERARDGDKAAFESLLAGWLEPAFRTALAILGNEPDARDATQEAFLATWRKLPQLVDDTLAQFEGVLERAPLETRVATVRDLFERVDVDSRELKAVAVWNMTTDQGVNRSDAVSEWLRR